MPRKLITRQDEITSAGGTIVFPVEDWVDAYVLYSTGSVSLSSSLTVSPSGTPQLGMEYLIYYQADLDLNKNTLTVFGQDIPNEYSDRKCSIRCYYNGSTWEVSTSIDLANLPVISSDMIGSAVIVGDNIQDGSLTTSKIKDSSITGDKLTAGTIDTISIADDAITTSKLVDGGVTLAKVDSSLLNDVITMDVSFESDSQCNNSITIPYDCTLSSIRYDVITDIEATDNAVISPQINTVSTSPSTINIAGGSAANTTGSQAMTTASITAGDELRLISSKTTAGGRARLTLTLLKTA